MHKNPFPVTEVEKTLGWNAEAVLMLWSSTAWYLAARKSVHWKDGLSEESKRPDHVEWRTNCASLSPHLWRLFCFSFPREWAFQLHLQSFIISDRDKKHHSVFYCHEVKMLVAFSLLHTEIIFLLFFFFLFVMYPNWLFDPLSLMKVQQVCKCSWVFMSSLREPAMVRKKE